MLVRKNFNSQGDLHVDMDRLFHDFFGNSLPKVNGNGAQKTYSPPAEVWEEEKHYCLEMDLPGMRMENLDIQVAGNEVIIQGTWTPQEHTGETINRKYFLRERAKSQFSRTFQLPTDVDSEKATAKLKDGILSVQLPKSETALPRRIKINTSE